jgi:thiamine-monophosphate kinase
MTIKELGGEFALIRRMMKHPASDPAVVKGIGDDCAAIRQADGTLLLVTTDMMVENDHFNTAWSTPARIGRKLVESNVSDIVAMGGVPKYAFLSMSITRETTVEFMDGFYAGLFAAAVRHGIFLLGGDTTHGTEYIFNLTLTGTVDEGGACFRSGARQGDLVCVTGTLGGSTAGLKLFLRGIKESGTDPSIRQCFLDHLEPWSRTVGEGRTIARFAHAMIDVSDGLAPEVTHICEESGTGALIELPSVPLSDATRAAGVILGLDPYDFALYGGEDFELVFTIDPLSLDALRAEFTDFTVVGEILHDREGIQVVKDGIRQPFARGYDHFA